MSAFKALLLEEIEGKVRARIADARRQRAAAGRGDGPGPLFDAQLQGRHDPQWHRPSRADLSACAGHRFRRHRRGVELAALQARRRGDPDRLARRRNALGRVCAEGAGRCEPARDAAGGHEPEARHGDRHGRLHRHARGDGARGAWAEAGRGRCAGDGRRGRARQRRRRDPRAPRPHRSRPRPAAPRRTIICARSAPPPFSTARNWRSRRSGRSRPSAGPARSTRSAAPPSPPC